MYSQMKTATIAPTAVVRRLFLKKAKTKAVSSPTDADITLPVEENTSGKIIAAITPYGRYAKNERKNRFFILCLKNASGIILGRYVTIAITATHAM